MSTIKLALKQINERFGIPEDVFDEYELEERGDIWILSREAAKFPIKRFSKRGLRLIRVFKDGYKLTTAGIQLFGKFATKNVAEISAGEVREFLEGKDISVSTPDLEVGQVIVKHNNDYLGSGLYQKGKIKNQLPRGRRWF
jgi:16S rRNA (cytosine1407-C5)-methyltransferase